MERNTMNYLYSILISIFTVTLSVSASIRISWEPVEPGEIFDYVHSTVITQNTDKIEKRVFDLRKGESANLQGTSYKALPPSPQRIACGIPIGAQHLLCVSESGTLWAYHTVTEKWFSLGAQVDKGSGLSLIAPDCVVCQKDGRATAARLVRKERFHLVNYVVVAIYFLIFIGCTVWMFLHEKQYTAEQYFKGGGQLPWWAVGVSIYAAMFSAISLIAGPAVSYILNWSYFTVVISKIFIIPIIAFCYLPFFRRLNLTSAYEYLEMRFNLPCRLFASAAFSCFMLLRSALVVFLPSLAVASIIGLPLDITIVGMTVLSAALCIAGGMKGIVWGDFYQGLILIVSIAITGILLIHGTDGGFAGFYRIATEANKFDLFNFAFDWSKPVFWVMLLGGFVSNLNSYTSDQCVLQRFMTTKDERSAVKSILFGVAITFLSGPMLYAIGTGLYTFYTSHPETLDITMSKNDAIFPIFIATHLPPGVGGLLVASLFAATMTTLAANLNATATAVTTDFVVRFRKTPADDTFIIRWGRLLTVAGGTIACLVAVLFAHLDIPSMQEYFYKVLGVLTSGITGLFLIGMFMPWVSGKVAITALVANYIVCFTLMYGDFTGKPHLMLYGVAGLLTCLVTAALLGIVFPRKNDRGRS